MEEASDVDWDSSTVRGRDSSQTTNVQQSLTNGIFDNYRISRKEIEQPRKYRVRKRHWQPDEDKLGEILQEELMAWRDVPLSQIPTHRTLRSPTGLLNKQNKQALSGDEEQIYSGTKVTSSTTLHRDETGSTISKIPLTTAAIKKSCFLEGSMNRTSRGTASVWTDLASLSSPNSRSASAVSWYDSEPSTPQNGPSSRMSLSTIDINEFKPLPPTPTTFKATMRRIGCKLKSGDTSSQQSKLDTTPNPSKAPRKGLRKSLSTWKIFDSAASEADDEAALESTKIELKTIRNAASSRTLRLLGRHKQPQIDPTLALLEERKRKAEVAYAEQFGTSKKRHKQDSKPIMRRSNTDDESEPISMRRRSSVTQTSDSSQIAEYLDPFFTNTMTLPPPLDLSTSTRTINQRISHRRDSFRDSVGSKDSDRDRRKRVSRSELEKENQHLRELLRERDTPGRTDRPRSSGKISSKELDLGSQGSSPARDRMRAALSSHPVNEDDTFSSTTHAIPTDSESKPTSHVEQTPPVPALPPSVVNRGVLRPVTNGLSWVSDDTATVKRRGPVTTIGRTIELPRPLSMVLEGLEDDQNEEDEDDRNIITKKPSSNEQASIDAKGSGLPGLKDCKENWDWPEDVF